MMQVNLITPFQAAASSSPELVQRFLEDVPMNRFAEPEQPTGTVLLAEAAKREQARPERTAFGLSSPPPLPSPARSPKCGAGAVTTRVTCPTTQGGNSILPATLRR